MKIKPVNENIFGAAKRFSDAFFDGLKNNATEKMLAKARKAGMERDAIVQMEKIKREKDELDRILSSIPMPGTLK